MFPFLPSKNECDFNNGQSKRVCADGARHFREESAYTVQAARLLERPKTMNGLKKVLATSGTMHRVCTARGQGRTCSMVTEKITVTREQDTACALTQGRSALEPHCTIGKGRRGGRNGG